jgi:hypothetical protein
MDKGYGVKRFLEYTFGIIFQPKKDWELIKLKARGLTAKFQGFSEFRN